MSTERLSQLMQTVLSERASEKECRLLAREIERNPSLQKELTRHIYMDTMLQAEVGGVQPEEGREEAIIAALDRALPGDSPAPRRGSHERRGLRVSSGPRIRWGTWIAVAACLSIIVGAHLVNLRQVERMPDIMMAKLAKMGKDVRVERNGKNITVYVHMDLFFNDVVRTGRNGRATVEYVGEATSVDLLSDTKVEFRDKNDAKHIYIPGGTIQCDVAPQPEGKPMVVTTPEAKAEIRGTSFSLAVAGGKTRIEVTKGMVRFSRLSDGESVDVAGGQYAVAAEGVELAALTLSDTVVRQDSRRLPMAELPPRSDYVLGDIIFEDDFDQSLDKWEILVGDDVNNLALVDKEIKGLANVSTTDKDRFGGMLGESVHNVVRIRLEDAGLEGNVFCLRTRLPITEEAFSVKYFVQDASVQAWTTPFPWAHVLSEKTHIRCDTIPGSHYLRWDCVPAGRDEDGTPLLETRRYMWSSSYTQYRKEQHYATRIIGCSDRRLGFAMRGRRANLVRVEVRRLIKRASDKGLDQ